MNKKEIEELFEKANGDIMCNTSYPLLPGYFAPYRTENSVNLFQNETDFSVYIHIPFCKSLCKFCEYTRFKSGKRDVEGEYVKMVVAEIDEFIKNNPQLKTIHGLDVGGGTPTALGIESFNVIMDAVKKILSTYEKSVDFQSSIEVSFNTLTEDHILSICDAGFTRMSAGIQTVSKKLLEKFDRDNGSAANMLHMMNFARQHGIEKFNLDMMYGLVGQNEENLRATVEYLSHFSPEQVTFYETRYNMNGMNHKGIDRDVFYNQYCVLFDEIKKYGYQGDFGQNAFGLTESNGVSSYLKNRMRHSTPYRGFGIAAQSMSDRGIVYNCMKGVKEENPDLPNVISAEYVYELPKEEVAGKAASISMYSGKIYLDTLSRILGCDAHEYYKTEIDFLLEKNLITIDGDTIKVTHDGFYYYGAITSLFWSNEQKTKYINSNV